MFAEPISSSTWEVLGIVHQKYPTWTWKSTPPGKYPGKFLEITRTGIFRVFGVSFPGTFRALLEYFSGYFQGTFQGLLWVHSGCFWCTFPVFSRVHRYFPGTFGGCRGLWGYFWGALGALSGVPRFRIFRRLFGVLSAFPEVPGFLEVRQIRTLCIAGGRDETGETRWRGRTGEALGGENGPKSTFLERFFTKIGHNSAPEASLELFSGLSILISPPASVSGHQGAR